MAPPDAAKPAPELSGNGPRNIDSLATVNDSKYSDKGGQPQAIIERNPAAVAATIKDLTIEYSVEAGHVAAIAARHFVDNMEIGDIRAAEHSLGVAVLHLREAAAKFREWQGKPLPMRDGAQ